jgi:hypothetical protein
MDRSKIFGSNKRGQAQYLLENAFRIAFLMIAMLVFFLLVNFYITNKLETNMLQAEVTANRIMYSDAFTHIDDDTSIAYTGIIDLEKFKDEETFNSKINYPTKRHAAANLTLINNDDGKIVATTYLNKAQYNIMYVLVKNNGKGKGSATMYIKQYPVTYYDGTKYNYGTITMKLIIPNS